MSSARRKSLLVATLAAATAVSAPAWASEKKLALAMFHFNVQYVAGGTVGFGGVSSERSPREIEDLIVKESLEPMLDLFLAHGWRQDIEMQGYMLEVIGERHPGVLEKIKRLALPIDSFHYSDQLFIAYPRVDWDRSMQLTDAVFSSLDVRRGVSIFCQEGQVGVGMSQPMTERHFAALVWPPNHWKYQHADLVPGPLYAFGESTVIVGQDARTEKDGNVVQSTWTFLDDGELLATGNSNPYLVSGFKRDEAALAAYEAKLLDLEKQGYVVGLVEDYRAALADIGVTPAPLPPMLDGTWQPQSTDGTHKWMGGKGGFVKDERDNDVRTLAAIAHRELVAAEAAAKAANVDAQEFLRAAWRLLALGQVSDGTGINPIRGEIEYALSHLSEAIRIARGVISASKQARGATSVAIDTASGVMSSDPKPLEGGRSVAAGPITPIVTAMDRSVRVEWSELEPNHFVVDIAIGAGDERVGEVRFPGDPAADIVYTPALTSSSVSVPRSAFTFPSFTLPLHDGLIGLGKDTYVIKDLAYVHLGARITTTSGDVVFGDDTMPAGEPVRWKLHVVVGSEERALAVARSLNVTPTVIR